MIHLKIEGYDEFSGKSIMFSSSSITRNFKPLKNFNVIFRESEDNTF